MERSLRIFEMHSMMAKVGCEMEKEENWQEDRRWMTLEQALTEEKKKTGNIGR